MAHAARAAALIWRNITPPCEPTRREMILQESILRSLTQVVSCSVPLSNPEARAGWIERCRNQPEEKEKANHVSRTGLYLCRQNLLSHTRVARVPSPAKARVGRTFLSAIFLPGDYSRKSPGP